MLIQLLNHLQDIVQSPRRITTRAVESAYAIWAKRYPEWEANFFDKHFLHIHVLPRFSTGEFPTATTLAEAWVIQMGASGEQAAALTNELTPVAADFLYVVKSERDFVEQTSARKWQAARSIVGLLSGNTPTSHVGNVS
ncbi:MAG: hypothetical protein R2867_08105 [Caldilineaceae bacterium]